LIDIHDTGFYSDFQVVYKLGKSSSKASVQFTVENSASKMNKLFVLAIVLLVSDAVSAAGGNWKNKFKYYFLYSGSWTGSACK
jgi:hypothetical protein